MTIIDRPASFDKRLMDNYKLICWYAGRFSRDQERREELIQETVARALSKWRAFREDGVFESWLYYVMLQVVSIDKEKKRPIASSDPEALSRLSVEPEQERVTDIANVMKAVAETEVLSLVAEGYEYAEIGRMKGVSRSVVWHQAARELSSLLGGQPDDAPSKRARKHDRMRAKLAAKEVA